MKKIVSRNVKDKFCVFLGKGPRIGAAKITHSEQSIQGEGTAKEAEGESGRW